MGTELLEISDLTVTYGDRDEVVTAVDHATLTVDANEYMGVVGESGSGKSTLANAIIGGLDPNGSIESGEIRYKGRRIDDMTESQLNEEIRWKEISWIPQASMNSLDPLKRINQQAVELAKFHTDLTKEEALENLEEAFEVVGLSPARISDYPHQLSGGMNQRAMIALAIFLNPSFIIADEPTTALDVIMQDRILKYLEGLRDETETAVLVITHDISVVFEFCDSMAVMHGAQIAETGTVDEIHSQPRHPYSILLQRSFPDFRDPDRELVEIPGNPPKLDDSTDFCSFADRCPWAVDACYERRPPTETISGSNRHRVACIRHEDVSSDELPTGEVN